MTDNTLPPDDPLQSAIDMSLGLDPFHGMSGLQFDAIYEAHKAGLDRYATFPRTVRQLRALGGLYAAYGDPLTMEVIEHWNALKTNPKIKDYLRRRFGIDYAAVAHLFIGVARILIEPGGRFQFADFRGKDGEAVLTLPMLTVAEDQSTPALDILAVSLKNRELRWRRTDTADVIAGDNLNFSWEGWPEKHGARIRLFSNALAFLEAGATRGGYLVVDWKSSRAKGLLRRLDACSIAAVVDDAKAAMELKALARPRRQSLKIEVVL